MPLYPCLTQPCTRRTISKWCIDTTIKLQTITDFGILMRVAYRGAKLLYDFEGRFIIRSMDCSSCFNKVIVLFFRI